MNKKMDILLSKMALSVIKTNVNTTCFFFLHQPELPKNSEKLKTHDHR